MKICLSAALRILALSLTAWLAMPATGAEVRIDHLEPAFWWAGMENKQLMLMVHGEGIADMTPALHYPGVTLRAVQKGDSKNTLFLHLRMSDAVRPGRFPITFTGQGKHATAMYELRARRPGAKERRGFTSADVILNLMPDRFANGDPANDSLPSLREAADRSDPSGRHGGDIAGIAAHLDYIAAMGYTAIWPTPLNESNQARYSYHGYAITDFYKIDARYGSNEDYRRLSAAARTKGLGLVHDMVLNHIGSGHWWMQDLPMRDWITHGGQFVPTRHFRTAVYDPYAAKVDADNFTTGWFEASMPDLNQRNPLVATYLIQNTIWWIEYADLAGVRVDTFGYSDKDFLSRWSRVVMQEYPNFTMVGEEWSNNPNVVAHWLRGKKNFDGFVSGMPGMIDFPLHSALRTALLDKEGIGSGFSTVYEMLSNDHLYPVPKNMLLFEGNHDVPRTFSALNEDIALWRMAMAYTLTMPRVAQLYYGSDILMTSPKERDDAGTRHDMPGGWAGDAVNAFTGAGLSTQQKDAQAFLRKLMNWRKGARVIHDGRLTHYGPENGIYVYFRHDAAKKVMVVLSKNAQDTPLPLGRFAEVMAGVTRGTDVISGAAFDLRRELLVPARGTLVLELAAP